MMVKYEKVSSQSRTVRIFIQTFKYVMPLVAFKTGCNNPEVLKHRAVIT